MKQLYIKLQFIVGTTAIMSSFNSVGTSVLTGIVAFGTTMMFAKGYGPRIGHNQHEKQMWNEAMRRLGINDKDLIRRLHNEIHKHPYADTLKKLLEILNEILEKMRY